MKTETMNTEIRELTDDELQNVSGGVSPVMDGLALALQGAMGPAGPLVNSLVTTALYIKKNL
jgi:lactobin A/cerein 7B family class IIb bacteriocin